MDFARIGDATGDVRRSFMKPVPMTAAPADDEPALPEHAAEAHDPSAWGDL